jgi:hypothetical protein
MAEARAETIWQRVKGFVHEVVVYPGSEVIARHLRRYEREDMIFDPLHYLALLEQKPNALLQTFKQEEVARAIDDALGLEY